MSFDAPSHAQRLSSLLHEASGGSVVFLTGAGISAPSGIPTFRGPGGYWTVGSAVYKAQEIGTLKHFRKRPWDVWAWYLYRAGVCGRAEPNAAHFALARLEESLGDRFHLITQNVDGLHTRAGNSQDRIYEVHGSGRRMRCAIGCSRDVYPIPELRGVAQGEEDVHPEDKAKLKCPRCDGMARPHILWWDEYYEEDHYRSESALRAVSESSLFVTVGTSGATSLPVHAAAIALQRNLVILDVNPDANLFRENAESAPRGLGIGGDALNAIPNLVDAIIGLWAPSA